MGVVASQINASIHPSSRYDDIGVIMEKKSQWRAVLTIDEAKNEYFLNEPNRLRPQHIELRLLLSDSMAFGFLSRNAKATHDCKLLNHWRDLQILRLATVSYSDKEQDRILQSIVDDFISERIRSHGKDVPPRMLQLQQSTLTWNEVEKSLFFEIYNTFFVSFLKTEQYKDLCIDIRKAYNFIQEDDFIYYDKISEGAYGLVVHAMRKTTGEHFAMKIQSKALMYQHYKNEPRKMMKEMQTLACCDHPFIVNLSYAFQTCIVAILTMPLCVYGDLGLLVLNSPNKRVPLPDVVFYAAEIVSALQYLHSQNLIYGDLKPANVLLQSDGHIKLADFGAIADVEGVISECICFTPDLRSGVISPYRTIQSPKGNYVHTDVCSISAIGVDECENSFSLKEMESEKRRDRAKSIVGTISYMAPEIILKFGSRAYNDMSYTAAVDYWSLGVTVYALIYGKLPFRHVKVEKMQQYLIHAMNKTGADHAVIFDKVFGRAVYSGVDNLGNASYDDGLGFDYLHEFGPLFHQNAVIIENFIENLLQYDPAKRLTALSVANTPTSLKSHKFFEHIDWDLLEKKGMQPPAIIPRMKSIAMGKYGPTGLNENGEFISEPYKPPRGRKQQAQQPQSYEINDLLINNGRKAWLLGETTEDLNVSIDETSNISSSPSRSNGNSRNYWYERKQTYRHLEAVNADHEVDEEVKMFYKVTVELQDLFADWYYVSPSIVESECKAQLLSRHFR